MQSERWHAGSGEEEPTVRAVRHNRDDAEQMNPTRGRDVCYPVLCNAASDAMHGR